MDPLAFRNSFTVGRFCSKAVDGKLEGFRTETICIAIILPDFFAGKLCFGLIRLNHTPVDERRGNIAVFQRGGFVTIILQIRRKAQTADEDVVAVRCFYKAAVAVLIDGFFNRGVGIFCRTGNWISLSAPCIIAAKLRAVLCDGVLVLGAVRSVSVEILHRKRGGKDNRIVRP